MRRSEYMFAKSSRRPDAATFDNRDFKQIGAAHLINRMSVWLKLWQAAGTGLIGET